LVFEAVGVCKDTEDDFDILEAAVDEGVAQYFQS
jgi:hypothetical protein